MLGSLKVYRLTDNPEGALHLRAVGLEKGNRALCQVDLMLMTFVRDLESLEFDRLPPGVCVGCKNKLKRMFL